VAARNSAAVADIKAGAADPTGAVAARSLPAAQAAGAVDRVAGAAPAAEVRVVVRRAAAGTVGVRAAAAVSREAVSREKR
jgi:hypothetical protein